MKIAFVSYEYPKETGGGGIGTYLTHIAPLLRDAGHTVVVFAGTAKMESFWETDLVFRFQAKSWKEFNLRLPDFFLPIHEKICFDIVEGTDFNGCGLFLKKRLPHLPFVIKLHTPLFLVDKLLFIPMSNRAKFTFALGALRRGKIPQFPKTPQYHKYSEEFEAISLADRISSPGKSISSVLRNNGFPLGDKVDFVPLPVIISPKIYNIQPKQEIIQAPIIVYIGRLETRKGVIDLAKAIPLVLKAHPGAIFHFVGRSAQSPKAGVDMKDYLLSMLKRFKENVIIDGEVAPCDINLYLEKGDVFVFPSHYESFGLACCEAMAAGKAVIGSEAGGMSEIIDNDISGILVKPKSPALLGKTINMIIQNNHLRLSLGYSARRRILTSYSGERILPMQVESYRRAIFDCEYRKI